jgi:2'-5' RNA ligase
VSEPRRLRLFVALDLPAPARAALARFRDAAADPAVWRPVDDAALHVTLAFLGHRPAADVDVVRDALAGLEQVPAPALALGPGLRLPPRRPRVLCADLEDPAGGLATLQRRVSDALAAAGVYQPEARPFRAHATVARLRARTRPPRGPVEPDPAPLAFHGDAVSLYASLLRPGGATYQRLVRLALAPPVP